MIKSKFFLWPFIITLALSGCKSSKDTNESEGGSAAVQELPTDVALSHTFYLIGDVGKAEHDPLEPCLKLLNRKLDSSDAANTTVLFLGDNIYRQGLHPQGEGTRERDEDRINAQLNILEGFDGRILFIPGNHDWNEGNKNGREFVKRQEKYIEAYLQKGNTFLPDSGCPGPILIELNEKTNLLTFDSEWWLYDHSQTKNGFRDCQTPNRSAFIEKVKKLIIESKDKQLVIAAHHPMYSNGNHGGYFNWKDHIFPLTSIRDYLYIPLPVIGSIYPLYRKHVGNIQDIPNKNYQTLKNPLTTMIADHGNVIYVSGHEHSLQHHEHDHSHYVVTGSGSKTDYVRDNDEVNFARDTKGFASLHIYVDGQTWLRFYAPIDKGDKEQILYSTKIDS